MKRLALILASAGALSVAQALVGQQLACPTSPQSCTGLTDAERAKLITYVQKKYKVQQSTALQLTDGTVPGSACYRKLEFASGDPRSAFRLTLFATPDLRYLTRELMDSSVDPIVEEQQRQAQLRDKLEHGTFAVAGFKDAPLTISVFSDFQCPYCAQAAVGLRKDLLPSLEGKVRIAFRNFPLAMHPWARGAAEAAACAQDQGDKYFWPLHDYVFEHQTDITMESVQRVLLGQAATLPGFDTRKFESCLDKKGGAARVDADLALGREIGVNGTPTLFLNGRPLTGYRPDQIRTMIRELTEAPAGQKVEAHQ